MLRDYPTTLQRAVETGRGEGGDLSLVIDRGAEDVVFALLDELHDAGHRFIAVSEERGEVDFGGGPVRVIIDPIDGSLNAKRDLPPHALSVAVADGPTMADVAFGYVFDFGTGQEWRAARGAGGARRRRARWTPRRASAARRRACSRWSASSPRTRAGSRLASTALLERGAPAAGVRDRSR